MEKKEGGKASVALSMAGVLVGLALSAALLGVPVGAQYAIVNLVTTPNIVVDAQVLSWRLGGGDAAIFEVRLHIYEKTGLETIASLSIVIRDVPDGTVYLRAGFHHVVIPAGGTVTLDKTLRMHHWSMVLLDSDAFYTAKWNMKRDGMSYPGNAMGSIDLAMWKAYLGVGV